MALLGEVFVDLGANSYTIYIGSGILDQLPRLMGPLGLGSRALVVSNPRVRGLYGEAVQGYLSRAGYAPLAADIPDSEEAKSFTQAQRLYDLAFEAGLDRLSPVLALGGGVVGDLTGFVASTYMRGVPFIQVPTTLLAQVDSSVGGKVAVNHPRGKNMIGSFYQPRLVLADVSLLGSLDKREIGSGLAEVIKYGFIADEQFLAWLEENIALLKALEPGATARAVQTSCALKASVVREDEREAGVRAILNFGHTLAHGVEVLSNYTLRHGEAVAIGMLFAARLGEALGITPGGLSGRVGRLVRAAGLPWEVPPEMAPEDLLAVMRHDKKAISGKLTFVLPVAPGKVEIFKDIAEGDILSLLRS